MRQLKVFFPFIYGDDFKEALRTFRVQSLNNQRFMTAYSIEYGGHELEQLLLEKVKTRAMAEV